MNTTPALVAATLLLALSTSHADDVSKSEKPNVILIVADDMGYGDMGCHGNPWLKTPILDQFRDEGVSLDNYHVNPVCTPTRAALMTGRYSSRVGAWAITDGRQLLNPDEKTMADAFTASGYQTAMFGKWHLGDTYPYAPRYRGFQDVVRHMSGGVDEIGNPNGNNFFDDTYFRNGKPEKFKGYCTDIWFDETLRFIDHNAGKKPFFIYLPLNAMHSPFNVDAKYSDPFMKRDVPEKQAKFYGMIENFDENLGRLTASLKKSGLDRNTIVIFMGDNGTAAGSDVRIAAKDIFNAGMRGMKGSVYEGGHRVACFVRWPEHFKAGLKVGQATAHLDWLPTLVELCGLSTPGGVKFDGISIAPLLEGNANAWPERNLFVDRQGDQLRKWDGSTGGGGPTQFTVISGKWRLVNDELYDITIDPGQEKNIAAQHPDIAKKLMSAYEKWFADVSSQSGDYTRFQIGTKMENSTTFTIRDWHPTKGRVIWEPSQLTDDAMFINGFWAVDVKRPGRYQVRISRYPDDALKPIGATQARLKIGEIENSQPVSPEAGSVTFEMDLKQGPTLLQTWLTDAATGKDRGAYFVSCKLLEDKPK